MTKVHHAQLSKTQRLYFDSDSTSQDAFDFAAPGSAVILVVVVAIDVVVDIVVVVVVVVSTR